MTIVGVHLYPSEPLLWVKKPDYGLSVGDSVILKTEDQSEEFGIVKRIMEASEYQRIYEEPAPLIKSQEMILRLVTPHDRQKIESLERRLPQAMEACRGIIATHNLPMRLTAGHFFFSGRGVLFLFTSESRVDFRGLVRDLANHLQCQVRLKQIGPRDRARLTGGYGRCGRPLCSATFLTKLDSVTMEMVRVQNLASKGAAKLSGLCGKLMCCLSFEVEVCKELQKSMPALGSVVRVGKKQAKVVTLDVLNQLVRVAYEDHMSEIIPVEKLTASS